MARANSFLLTDELLHKAVEEYTGAKVRNFRRADDPHVAGAIAIRCTVLEGQPNGGKDIDFLLPANVPALTSLEDVVSYLEECTFKQWPPATGKLRFS